MSELDRVAVTIYLTRGAYRALVAIATRKGTQVHRMIEAVVTRSVGARTADDAVKRPRRPGEELDQIIRELNGRGLGENQIAKRIGMSQTAISARRRKLGIESPTPKARPKS